MGVSSTVNVALGFRINPEDLFDFEEFETASCVHYNDNPMLDRNADWCPDCGIKLRIHTGTERKLKARFDGIINGDQDSMYNEAWHTQIDKFKVTLREIINNYGGDTGIFVGIWLDSFDPKFDERMVRFISNPVDLPREDILKKTLMMHGIPFDPDSFGIYLLTDWY